MKVIIDPLYHPLYATFYLKALIEKFGKRNIVFSRKPFEKLKAPEVFCFNFVIENDGKEQKYSIDHCDSDRILDTDSYHWCDVFGKVNTNWAKTPKAQFPKLVSLLPSFGVRAFGTWQSLLHLSKILFKAKFNVTNFKKFVGKYKRLWQNRLFLEEYENTVFAGENYVFHLSTLWYNDEWNKNDEGVNRVRANFIRVCKRLPNIRFEGGLLSKTNNPLFEDVIYRSDRQMSINEYVTKTKKSVFVFNTPSFWNCHGWKLGEYLAMGKAIISTPLSNDLPYPPEHGINIHFLKNDSEEELENAINQIVNHLDYRKKLETGAKKYWETYGTPEKSLELLGIK